MNMIPTLVQPGIHIQPILQFKEDHECVMSCCPGEAGLDVGPSTHCWKCDKEQAATRIGLCRNCLRELRSW